MVLYPNSLPHCHFTFKASFKNDPDSPVLQEAMIVMHKEGIKEAMSKEIDTLELVKNWNVMTRNNLPEGLNILPLTWALKIKRYPDGRFLKFKIFFVIEDISDKRYWTTVNLIIQCWDGLQLYLCIFCQ